MQRYSRYPGFMMRQNEYDSDSDNSVSSSTDSSTFRIHRPSTQIAQQKTLTFGSVITLIIRDHIIFPFFQGFGWKFIQISTMLLKQGKFWSRFWNSWRNSYGNGEEIKLPPNNSSQPISYTL
ncbi:hypothetical protein K7432_014045 [Basidiobolus ranarum]|uniref:Uncharacterized protein n=1 Tax=Basidiobolus ranarum TaxID=34480 RepID=A0ABR2WIA3_9FUNG